MGQKVSLKYTLYVLNFSFLTDEEFQGWKNTVDLYSISVYIIHTGIFLLPHEISINNSCVMDFMWIFILIACI